MYRMRPERVPRDGMVMVRDQRMGPKVTAMVAGLALITFSIRRGVRPHAGATYIPGPAGLARLASWRNAEKATALYLPVCAQVQYSSYYSATLLLACYLCRYFATARYSTVQVPQQRANALYISHWASSSVIQSRQYWAVY